MRKITKESSKAFVNFEQFKKSNTRVEVFNDTDKRVVNLYLHGNLIAEISQTGNVFQDRNHESGLPMLGFSVDTSKVNIDLCGWHTLTTRERINGILDALGYDFRIAQRNHEQVLIRLRRRRWTFNPNGESSETYLEDILKLSDDSFDPDFAKEVFNSKEFVNGTDLNAITDF